MSCNGCRVLRKGCSDRCVLRTCLQWIGSAEAQAHATLFVAKFFGRSGLFRLITAVQEKHRPALFRSLLYEACGRTVNPVYGAVGLLWSGEWDLCHAAVDSVLRNGSLRAIEQAAVLPTSENIQLRIIEQPEELPAIIFQKIFPRNGNDKIYEQNIPRKRPHTHTQILPSQAAGGMPMAIKFANPIIKNDLQSEVQQPDHESTSIDHIDLDLKLKSYSAASHELFNWGVRTNISPCYSVCSDSSTSSLGSTDLAISPTIADTKANHHGVNALNLL